MYLGIREFRPLRTDLAVATAPSGTKTLYRFARKSDGTFNSDHTTGWIATTEKRRYVKVQINDERTERTYYTGDGVPKVTDNTVALATPPYPTAWRPLGIPAPAAAMTVTTDAGTFTGATQTYYYTYTYVNDWGWESAPAPVSLVNSRPSDATATLSAFSTVPAGNYQINRIRIYRTQTGDSGTAEFFFLREIAIGTTTTGDDNRALGEVIPTDGWLTPPADLSYLTTLWNGMAAGITGNAVRLCEPFTPYAWPIAYEVLPPDSKPVALATFGQALLVLTTGRPLLVQGSSPDSMDQLPLEIEQACIAPRSAVSMGSGVAWASEDGLCWFGASGARLLTSGLMTREDWQALVPSSFVGCMYEGLYFGSYDDGAGRKGFFIDPGNPTGIYFLDTGYSGLHFDRLRDQLYVLDGTNVKKWDAGAAMTARFRSKLFDAPRPMNFTCAEVKADAYPVTLRLYADGALKATKTVASATPFRLPSGYLARTWQIELEGTTAVQSAAIATSMAELAQV